MSLISSLEKNTTGRSNVFAVVMMAGSSALRSMLAKLRMASVESLSAAKMRRTSSVTSSAEVPRLQPKPTTRFFGRSNNHLLLSAGSRSETQMPGASFRKTLDSPPL